MTIATLAGGSWIFLAFLIIAFFGVAFGYFTVKGSGITPRAYGKVYSRAPGAKRGGDASGRDKYERVNDWSGGSRQPGRRAARMSTRSPSNGTPSPASSRRWR